MKKLLFILTFLFPLFAVGQTDSSITINEEPIWDIVEEPPVYPAGYAAMVKFVRENIVYPDSTVENAIGSKVIIKFVVEPDSSASNVIVYKTFDKYLGEEVARVVKLMKWQPGKQAGKAVRVRYSLPITFEIR